MVSTRHHPRPFPEPDLTPSRAPATPTTTTSGSPPPKASPSRRSPTQRKSATSATKSDSNDTKDIVQIQKSPTRRSTRTRRGSKPSLRTPRVFSHTPPPFLLIWLLVSVPLVLWDTGYVLGRPYTMPGGAFHSPLWKPYALYGTIDHVYGFEAVEKKMGFTAAQGTLNAVESVIYIWYLVVISRRVVTGDGFVRGIVSKLNIFSRRDEDGDAKIVVSGGEDVAIAVVLLFAATVMTLSKTVLYWLNEYFSGFAHIGHNDWATLFWLWIVPNGAWLVLPTYMLWVLGKEIVEAIAFEDKD